MSRNTHHRGDRLHFGETLATLIDLAETIGDHAAGTDLETVLADLDARIGSLNPPYLTIDAVLRKVITGSFTLDSIKRALVSASFTVDSYLAADTFGFTLDSVLKRTWAGSLTLDGVLREVQSASLTLDSVLRRVQAASFTADAVLKKAQSGSFTLDAVIDDGTEEGFDSFYGGIVLGESGYGDTP